MANHSILIRREQSRLEDIVILVSPTSVHSVNRTGSFHLSFITGIPYYCIFTGLHIRS